MIATGRITSANAREMVARSIAVRKQRAIERKAPAVKIVTNTVETVTCTAEELVVREQIKMLDRDFVKADDPMMRVRISDAKAKLWQLIHPRPGVLKPKLSKTRAEASPQPLGPSTETP